MPTITIDRQEVEVEAGTTVIQAADGLGIDIPRYCYHPGLAIAGSCRMCMVEIENMPKLQIACNTVVQDGMTVITDSEAVRKTRTAMLEFLLTDHPLDCPVCDQSGECDLQNFYMEHGRHSSRFLENKVKRKKAFAIGPHVMLDQERCVLCTRCVRFTEEISKSNELGVFSRGGSSNIDLFPDTTLDNPYSGNVIDICPVGALTEREFRFKCRVWYLSEQDSICTGCSRGCNISLHYNAARSYKAGGRRVMRLKPRFNPEVNQWWICDQGRFGYEFIDENRIEYPQVTNAPVEWSEAIEKAATAIKDALENAGPESVGVILSPQLSNEELLLSKELFVESMKLPNVAISNPWEVPGPADDLLRKADLNPNTRGAAEIGLKGDARSLLEKAAEGEIKVLYIFGHDFDSDEARKLIEKTAFVIFQGTNWNSTARIADIVFAGTTHAEKDGTFTNFEGRIQLFKQALLPLEDSKADSEILSLLANHLGHSLPEALEDVYRAWQGYSWDELTEHGEIVNGRSAVKA